MFKKLLTYSILSLIGMMGFFGRYDNYVMDGGINTYAECVTGADGNRICDTSMGASAKTTESQNADTAIKDMINKVIVGWNLALGLLTAIVSPAIMLAGWLMSPDWTSGDLFGIRPILHSLWVTVSNITYFIYAILLIFIALATIFNSQHYGYKQMLPKLALGIILVPLTWWFVQFVISLSSYVTASVMNIPMETLSKYTSNSATPPWISNKIIPKRFEYSNTIQDISKEESKIDCAKQESDCLSAQEVVGKAGGMYSPLLIYGYGIFKVGDIKNLNNLTDLVKGATQVAHQVIFGAIMFTVFGLLVLALVFMLMMRAIKLWFYAIFSPLMTLRYVIGDGFGGEGKESFDIKEFIGLAFVPALVGLSLSFGIVIVSLLQSSNIGGSGTLTAPKPCDDALIRGVGCELVGIMGNPENKIVRKVTGPDNDLVSVNEIVIGGITWAFKGKVTSISDSVASINNSKGVLSSAGGIFGTMIIDIIALVFIWVAFMAAKNVSKATKAAVEPFEQMGKKIGSLGASLPKYAPLPLPGGSIAGMGKITEKVSEIPVAAADKRAKDSQLGRMLGMGNQPATVDMRRVEDRIRTAKDEAVGNNNTHKEIVADLSKNADKYIEKEKAYKDYMSQLKETYKGDTYKMAESMKNAGMNEESAKKIAESINKDRMDLSTNKELLDAWKATAATKSGSSTGGAGTTNFNAQITEKAGGKKLEMSIGNVKVELEGGKINAEEISKAFIDKKDTKKVTEQEIQSQLSGLGKTVIDDIIKKLKSGDYFTETKK